MLETTVTIQLVGRRGTYELGFLHLHSIYFKYYSKTTRIFLQSKSRKYARKKIKFSIGEMVNRFLFDSNYYESIN